MRRVVVLVAMTVLLSSAGCPASSNSPDAAGVDASSDGGAGAGITVAWRSASAIPGEIDATTTLDAVRLGLRSVRVLGDAATGDERTTASDLELRWELARAPAPTVFALAPPGMYAEIELRLGGSDAANVELRGQTLVEGTWMPYRIEIVDAVTAMVDLDTVLAPGGSLDLRVDADLAQVVAVVDFATVKQKEDGVLVVEGNAPEVLEALRTCFSLGE